MENQIMEMLMETMFIVLGGLMSLAVAQFSLWLTKAKKKTELELQKIGDEKTIMILNDALNRTESLIRTTVISFENTIKKGLLEAVKDGELKKEDLECLLDMVKADVLEQLSKDTKDILSTNINDLNLYLEHKIEEELAIIHRQA